MGDISANINRYEIKCKCGKCNVTIQDHEPVIEIVQQVCDHFADLYNVDKVVLEITSAARCYEYNRSRNVGSNDESQHPRCCAMDIKLFVNGKQIPPSYVFVYLNDFYPTRLGIGNYKTFTHVDTRNKKSRW